MCIIWIKQKGMELPSKEIIRNMCINNPHGNGYMYAENGKVKIRKGFMSFEEYYKELISIPNIKDINLIGHCRITTHGGTSKENCHPFPLSNKLQDLQATSIESNIGIVHNGVIHGIKISEREEKQNLSDTMCYIKNALFPKYYRKDKNFYNAEKNLQKIEGEILSKMVIMDSKGDFKIIGKFIEDNGYIYSNDTYINYEAYDWYGNSYPCIGYNGEILLEDTDYIELQGQKIYGKDTELFLTEEGVFYEDWETYELIKISDVAYNQYGILISYESRLNGINDLDYYEYEEEDYWFNDYDKILNF